MEKSAPLSPFNLHYRQKKVTQFSFQWFHLLVPGLLSSDLNFRLFPQLRNIQNRFNADEAMKNGPLAATAHPASPPVTDRNLELRIFLATDAVLVLTVL